MLEGVCKRLNHLATHKVVWEKVNFRCYPKLLQKTANLSNFLSKRNAIKTLTLCDLNSFVTPSSMDLLANS